MLDWARRHPIVAFLIIGYGIPWIGWSVRSLLFADQPLDQAEWSTGSWALYYSGGGLLVAGFVMSWVTAGRRGVMDLMRRMLRWRVSPWMWIYALVTPLVFGALGWLAAQYAGGADLGPFQPWRSYLLFSPAILFLFTIGPLCEEAGWRGFLLPKLMETHNALAASLIIGFLWTMWHYPLSFMPNFFDQFQTAPGLFFYFVIVTAFSVHFTFLALRTGGSVLLAMVLHWTINAQGQGAVRALFPEADEAALAQLAEVAWMPLVGLLLWSVSAILIVIITGRHLSPDRRPAPFPPPGASA